MGMADPRRGSGGDAVTGHEELVRSFFECYDRGDRDAAAAMLAEDLRAYVTNAEAGVDVVVGRDEYVSRVPDLRAAAGSATVVQLTAIDDERVLTMVEIRAAHAGTTLHNFAGFLAVVRDGQIAELWMVDAKPAESDRFWR